MKYQVIVGNIGQVVDTDSQSEALRTFDAYVELSKLDMGRAAGESVTMLEDGQPVCDFLGAYDPSIEEGTL